MVLTRQFTKRSTLDDKDGCQGLGHSKKSGTCQHVLLNFVLTLTLARWTSWNGMERVHRHLSIVGTATVGKKHRLHSCWTA